MLKKILIGVLLVVVALCIYFWSLISYGVAQGLGQWKIIREARPVEEFLNDPNFPDSLKTKLRLVQQARRFAIDSLGLQDTENYTTLYDQKGEELMWVVTACEEFRLKPKEWHFPVVGSVPYKGYFDKEKAMREKEGLEKAGWDVSVLNPGGWSTLGWFTDPILSGMLRRSDGDLASTIIHEMVHATIFVKDSVEFNENLASFIGDQGAALFLLRTVGDTALAYREFTHYDGDYRKLSDHMMRAAKKLDSLYISFDDGLSTEVKKEKKQAFIQKIVDTVDTLTFSDGRKRIKRSPRRLPNNTYFMNYLTYESKHDTMKEDWERIFNRDLKAMIRYYQKRYPFL